MNKLPEHIIAITLVLLMLTACAPVSGLMPFGPELLPGDVLATSPGTAQLTIKQAIEGYPCTRIFTNGELYMFARSISNGWSFVTVDSSMKTILDPARGNFTSTSSMNELVTHLKMNGWESISPDKIPTWMTFNRIVMWLMARGVPIIHFIALPQGVFEDVFQDPMFLMEPKS